MTEFVQITPEHEQCALEASERIAELEAENAMLIEQRAEAIQIAGRKLGEARNEILELRAALKSQLGGGGNGIPVTDAERYRYVDKHLAVGRFHRDPRGHCNCEFEYVGTSTIDAALQQGNESQQLPTMRPDKGATEMPTESIEAAALRVARESAVMEQLIGTGYLDVFAKDFAHRLLAELAKEAEPVAWKILDGYGGCIWVDHPINKSGEQWAMLHGDSAIPLYLHPPIEQQSHTDHPLRHYDRTCPACEQEPPAVASGGGGGGKPEISDS